MNLVPTDILSPESADVVAPPETEPAPADFDAPLEDSNQNTDVDASVRFVEANRDRLRFCGGIGWLYWDGRRWASDATKHVLELAKRTARSWTYSCQQYRGDDRDQKLKAARRYENIARIKAVIELAASDPRVAVHHASLDAHPWLLNVRNGTIDLRTGNLRGHRREDMITKLAPVRYDPEARHVTLDRYLGVCDRAGIGIREFLARCFGAALTGDASAESLFLLQGEGGSGKTTLVEGMGAMLGDYAVKMPFEAFCLSSFRSPNGATPDIMRLRGARLAYASEGDASARLDAGRIKELTGNEPITARGLYRDPVTFAQTWKLWLVSNFDPKVDSDDTGIWRRMVKTSFPVIPEEDRDPEIKRVLTQDPEARSALLAYCVQGCLDWQRRGAGREGLFLPDAVREATDAYRRAQDTLSDWWADLAATAELGPEWQESTKNLRGHYQEWCDENGAMPVGAVRFGKYLERNGLKRYRCSAFRGWSGISLTSY